MPLKTIFHAIALGIGLLAGNSAIAGMSSAMIQHCTPAPPGNPPVCIVRNVAVDTNQNTRLHM